MADKPVLGVDFDGVLHAYTSGYQGINIIPDGPVPGAMAWLREAVEEFHVHVYSARSRAQGGRDAMKKALLDWLIAEHGEVVGRIVHALIHFPQYKPSALVFLDDRAVTFTGVFPPPSELRAFKTWQQPTDSETKTPK